MRSTQKLIASLGLIVISAACGGSSPTQPSPLAGSSAVVTTEPTPAPPSPPTNPTPPGNPAPPGTPAPVPPAPQPLETYAATTTQAHWFGPDRTPLFGDTFVIEVWPTDIWVNNTRLPIVHRADDGLLIAREGPMIEVELRPSTGRWYLRGGKGDADGTMVRR